MKVLQLFYVSGKRERKIRMRRYLIYTEGKVTNLQGKSYVINAKTPQEAKALAKKEFGAEYGNDGEIYVSEATDRSKETIASLACMCLAIFLSFISWKSEHSTINIMPDLISTSIALVIYSAYVLRFKGWYRMTRTIEIIYLIASTLLLSSFIQCLLSTSTFKVIIWSITIDCKALLVLAVILSWLGMKLFSVCCMAVICICAFFKIADLNVAMGHIWGPVYILSAFIGIVMYLAVDPAFQEIMPYYRKVAQRAFMFAKNDIMEAEKEADVMRKKIKNGSTCAGNAAKKLYENEKNKEEFEVDKQEK